MTSHRLVSLGILSTLLCAAAPACTVKSRNFGTDTADASSGGGTDRHEAGAAGSGGSIGSGGVPNFGGSDGNPNIGGFPMGGTTGDGGVVCTPNAPACDGNRATTCSKDGMSYAPGGMNCGTGRTCQAGVCKDDPCKPGTDFCRGTEIRTCASDGSTSTLKKPCAQAQYCEAASVTCKAQVCTPNTHDCVTGNLCAADGSGSVPDAPPCDGTCTPDGTCQCIPGHLRCGGADNSQPQLCVEQDDAGPMWRDNGTPCTNAADSGCGMGRCVAKTIQVFAGNYERNNNNMKYPASVANFQLDQYEVTVGQFRRFVDAIVAGWVPANGSGKHTHLNNGNGLVNSGTDGGNEVGWRTAWADMYLSHKREDWNANLTNTGPGLGGSKFATWTPAIGPYENRPINLVTWYEAYAYCIWDGGFLPSEAEWEWAARGAGMGYPYPWGTEDPPMDGSRAVYGCFFPKGSNGQCDPTMGQKNIADVNGGPAIAGQSFKGHAHMAGNVWEWVLDYHVDSVYPPTCNNCANTDPAPAAVQPPPAGPSRVHRGGDFFFYMDDLYTYSHRNYPANYRDHYGGFRCARSP